MPASDLSSRTLRAARPLRPVGMETMRRQTKAKRSHSGTAAAGGKAKAARASSRGTKAQKTVEAKKADGQTEAAETEEAAAAREAEAAEAAQAKGVLRDLKTIVINLERRADRMLGCSARLQKNCDGLRFSRFSATDGRATPIPSSEVGSSWSTERNVEFQKERAIRKGWDDLDTYKVRQLELSPGERGCSSSHIRAWRHCLELAGDTERPLLVLEDDAAPTENFAVILARALAALPSDAHLLYLGYSQAAAWRREVSPELVESKYVWTTVGYIVWPAGARILLSKLPVDEPVDNWMAGLCAQDDIKAYCVRPKVIHQADAWNVNSDVAHSDEHYWGPNSDIRHSDEFYWGPKAESSSRSEVMGSCFWDIDSDESEDSTDEA